MAVRSAGLLVYRRSKELEVLLVHPGGPFWAKKDVWSIPKGETEEDEDLQAAAIREFREELSVDVPEGTHTGLGSAKQGSKTNYIWAVEGYPDIRGFVSNTFTMEWPAKVRPAAEFPENSRAAWFSINEARQKVFKAQQIFFDRLAEELHFELDEPPGTTISVIIFFNEGYDSFCDGYDAPAGITFLFSNVLNFFKIVIPDSIGNPFPTEQG